MFLRSIITSSSVYRNYAISSITKISVYNKFASVRTFGYAYNNVDTLLRSISVILPKCQVHRCYSRNLSGDILDPQNELKERDLAHITSLFPNARVALNEMAARCPGDVFEVHYKQSVVAPKVAKKKIAQNDWTCTYAFVWPQKIKFEGTALSKRQAAEKAAQLALHWLYINKRISNKGNPMFDKTVIQELNESLQEPFKASISAEAMEKIDNIWDDYETSIREIYNVTFEEAKNRVVTTPTSMTKDSTIDEEDELAEDSKPPDASADAAEPTSVHPVYCKHVPRPTETALDRRKRQLMKTLEVYDSERTPLPIDDYSPSAAYLTDDYFASKIVPVIWDVI